MATASSDGYHAGCSMSLYRTGVSSIARTTYTTPHQRGTVIATAIASVRVNRYVLRGARVAHPAHAKRVALTTTRPGMSGSTA
jgi:hypothetical protein